MSYNNTVVLFRTTPPGTSGKKTFSSQLRQFAFSAFFAFFVFSAFSAFFACTIKQIVITEIPTVKPDDNGFVL